MKISCGETIEVLNQGGVEAYGKLNDLVECIRQSQEDWKDKIERAAPVPMDVHEAMLLDSIHVMSLPTIAEIYKEIGLLCLKYAIGIGTFLAGWWLLSGILDEVAMLLGY